MEVPFAADKDERGACVQASRMFFSRECVLAVANLYAGTYDVSVEPSGADHVAITLYSRDGTPVEGSVLRGLMNELVDWQVKMDLQKEFGGLRNRIVEYAFSPVSGR